MQEKKNTYTFAILLFSAVVAMLPNSVLFPATRDIAQHLHVSISMIGLMVTAYSVAYVVATPFLGVLSDHVGRKIILTGGLTVFAVGGLFPLVTSSWPIILIGRAVMGIGSAGILPMVDSVIGDMYEAGPKRRSALAGFAAAVAVADALVPFIGGVLDAWQWRAVFAVYALGLLAAVCCAYLALPAVTNQVERTTFSAYVQGLRFATKMPSLIAAVSGTVLFGTAYFGFCSLLPMALPGAPSGLAGGLLFLPIGTAWVITSTWLSKKPHLPNVHVHAGVWALILFVVTVCMAHLHNMVLLFAVAAIWGCASAVITTMYTWVVGDETPDMVRGAMNAVLNAGFVLGFSMGAPVFIALKEVFGYTVSTTLVGVLMLVAAVISMRWMKSSVHPASGVVAPVQSTNL